MKKNVVLGLVTSILMMCEGFCVETEIVNSIYENGSVILKSTNVLGSLVVNGSLNAEDSVIRSLQVNGQANLKNCVINSLSTINGSLHADNTQFQQELSVASQKITLKTCSIASLIVRKTDGYEGIQIINLRNGTNVTGPIIVESGNGQIWMSSDSKISGQVSGAQVLGK